MGKPTICIGENKGADQLRINREADQRHCFRYSDSTIPLLLKSEISSFMLFSVLVQVGLCRTCSETTLLVFPRGGSIMLHFEYWTLFPIITMSITVTKIFILLVYVYVKIECNTSSPRATIAHLRVNKYSHWTM